MLRWAEGNGGRVADRIEAIYQKLALFKAFGEISDLVDAQSMITALVQTEQDRLRKTLTDWNNNYET